MKTILVPVDFSPVTSRVVEAAIELARSAGGEIALLHVVPEPSSVRDALPAIEDTGQRRNSLKVLAERELEEIKRRHSLRSSEIRSEVLAGKAVDLILGRARELNAQYVVIGSHDHSAVREAILGSVARGVVRGSPAPVLLVPAHE